MLSKVNAILARVGDVRSQVTPIASFEHLYSTYYRNYSDGLDAFIDMLVKYTANKGNPLDIEKENRILFRGLRDIEPALYLLKPGIRLSQDTNNLYNILVSEMVPSWKGWPRRNRSTICTNSVKEAHEYARKEPYSIRIVAAVIPPNGAELTVCPENDMWMSFKSFSLDRFTRNLSLFLNVFYSIFKINDFDNLHSRIDEIANLSCKNLIPETSSDELYDLFTQIEDFIMSLDNDGFFEIKNIVITTLQRLRNWDNKKPGLTSSLSFNRIISLIVLNKKIIEILDKLLNPKANNFHIEYYSKDSFISKAGMYRNKEIWTEAKCLVINLDRVISDPVVMSNIMKIFKIRV